MADVVSQMENFSETEREREREGKKSNIPFKFSLSCHILQIFFSHSYRSGFDHFFPSIFIFLSSLFH